MLRDPDFSTEVYVGLNLQKGEGSETGFNTAQYEYGNVLGLMKESFTKHS